MQIDVSFEVWKALTLMRQSEQDDYNTVIERLLQNQTPFLSVAKIPPTPTPPAGLYMKEAYFPEGTQFRATYKGKTHYAKIAGGEWIDAENGETRTSPSQAAAEITGNSTNGWLFWRVKTPDMLDWKPLLSLRKKV